MWKRFLRRIGLAPPIATPICDLNIGAEICIEGVALAMGTPSRAPFTGTPAATMTVVQMELAENAQGNRPSWKTTNDIDFGQTFYVRDETGVVRVDRKGWSTLKAPRVAASRIPWPRHDECVGHFREVHRNSTELGLLDRVGLDRGVPNVKSFEIVLPHEHRVRIIGEVRATGEPMPTGAGMPIVPTGFRESPTLLEFVPGQKKLRIEIIST